MFAISRDTEDIEQKVAGRKNVQSGRIYSDDGKNLKAVRDSRAFAA